MGLWLGETACVCTNTYTYQLSNSALLRNEHTTQIHYLANPSPSGSSPTACASPTAIHYSTFNHTKQHPLIKGNGVL